MRRKPNTKSLFCILRSEICILANVCASVFRLVIPGKLGYTALMSDLQWNSITLEDDDITAELPAEEAALLSLRAALITLMQDDSLPTEARLDALLDAVDFVIPDRDWAEIYRTLERLDPKWDDLLNTLPAKGADGQPVSLFTAEAQALDTAYAQFCIYLLYRHLPGALLDDDIPGRAAFCVLSTRVLMALCAGCPGCTLADCTEIARMYSAEIEYSEDNIAALLDALWEA